MSVSQEASGPAVQEVPQDSAGAQQEQTAEQQSQQQAGSGTSQVTANVDPFNVDTGYDPELVVEVTKGL